MYPRCSLFILLNLGWMVTPLARVFGNNKSLRIADNIAGAHLGFSEGRAPNFRKGGNQYKTKKKRI